MLWQCDIINSLNNCPDENKWYKISHHIMYYPYRISVIDWMSVYPQNSYVEILTSNVMGPLGDKIKSWGWNPNEWNRYPYKRDPREFSCPLHHVRTAIFIQEAKLIRPRICQTFEHPSLQNCEKCLLFTPLSTFVITACT